jgi:hypothetical protein
VSVGEEVFYFPGTYDIPLIAQDGCDSIVHLTLVVFPVFEDFLFETICEGDVYVIGDEEFTVTGNYTIPLLSTGGCDSIIYLSLIVEPPDEIFLSETLCDGDVYVIGTEEFTTAGTYEVVLSNSLGCDSIVQAELEFIEVDIAVTQTGEQLSANLLDATYQWIDCNSGLNIPGATGREFKPTVSGSYAVMITDPNGCQGTSDCFSVVISAVTETISSAHVRFYPNPASEYVRMELRPQIMLDELTIYDPMGAMITRYPSPVHEIIMLEHLTTGIYLFELKVGNDVVVQKIVVIKP